MKIILKFAIVLLTGTLVFSCTDKHEKAQSCFDKAKSLYQSKDYSASLSMLDSIKKVDAKAFEQIKAGLDFKQVVQRAQNLQTISMCDSMLIGYKLKEDSLKKLFVFQQNKQYQQKITFVPKETSDTKLAGTMIRSGVNQDGDMYIESVYIGNQLHNKIKVSAKDGTSSETLPVNDEGLNFRFSNLGKQYEVIKITKAKDNGLTQFVVKNADKPLTAILEGKGETRFTLSPMLKNAIVKSHQLSNLLLAKDSILSLKDRLALQNKQLDKMSLQK